MASKELKDNSMTQSRGDTGKCPVYVAACNDQGYQCRISGWDIQDDRDHRDEACGSHRRAARLPWGSSDHKTDTHCDRKTAKEMLKINKKAEEGAIKLYKGIITLAGKEGECGDQKAL